MSLMSPTSRLALVLVSLLLLLGRPALAGDIQVRDAWVRGTVKGQTVTGAFMYVDAQRAAWLVEASSPIASGVELLEMNYAGRGPLVPKKVDRLLLVRGGNELTPVTGHLSLTGLQRQIVAGEQIPLRLVFRFGDGSQETLNVTASGRDFYVPGTSRR